MIRLVSAAARGLGRETVSPEGMPLPPGVRVLRSRMVARLGGLFAGMGGPAAGVTLGRTILLHPDVRPTVRLLRHELAHVSQWERYPVTFPFRYIGAHIRHGYGRNPFEVEARAAENGPGQNGARS